MANNERNAGRRGIMNKKRVTVFVTGEESVRIIKKEAKKLQILEPRLKGKSNGIHSIKKD